MLFFIAAAPFYIPTSGARGFQFHHILTNTSYVMLFDNNYLNGREVVSHCGFALHSPYD